MSSQFGFIDIIILAMFAGFIILRLRNILGRKTGHQGKPMNKYFPRGTVLKDIETIFPDISYCNDNAAMIAFLGEKKSKIIRKDSLGFVIKPNLKLK